MLIRWAELYENTEVLSPIDKETWQVLGDTCGIGPWSRVIELASGKGALAMYLTTRFGCSVDCYDTNQEFIDYSTNRANKLGLSSKIKFTCSDVNKLLVEDRAYDLGVCLGALYIFREAGWKALTTAVKPEGYIAVSDMLCKKTPPPRELVDVFFEEEEGPGPIELEDVRSWYADRGFRILLEKECSCRAWLEYYDLTREMLDILSKKYQGDGEREAEIKEALREDKLVRRYREEYLGYMTFIMRKA